MDAYRQPHRKIDPSRGELLGDGSPNDADRIEIGPTLLAFREWEEAGIALPNLEAMRKFRWERLTRHLVDRDYGGILVFDPLNIRYATDTTNMQLWNTHNPFRAVLLCADGYMVMFEYKNSPFLSDFNPLVRFGPAPPSSTSRPATIQKKGHEALPPRSMKSCANTRDPTAGLPSTRSCRTASKL